MMYLDQTRVSDNAFGLPVYVPEWLPMTGMEGTEPDPGLYLPRLNDIDFLRDYPRN